MHVKSTNWLATIPVALGLAVMAAPHSAGAQPFACPPTPTRVVRSAGGVIDYVGTVPGVPQLCRQMRANGPGNYYFSIWRDEWPGAGLAFPALTRVLSEGKDARVSFVTRSVPGLQWVDSYTNEGQETLEVDGRSYRVQRLAHERQGIEDNTYHSIITLWLEVDTGMLLKAVENQIAGQSYGPEATWTAIRIEPLR